MSAAQPVVERDSVPTRSVWFGAAAAAVSFSLNGLVNWVISWRTCYIGHGEFLGLHLGGVRWLLAAITLGFLCVLGVILSITLSMGIIWLGIPVIFLDMCMRTN